eukprot:GFYU01015048.1.p1 GENE.GFYU01015048.1~~GFYU01015048.1.p1  ORF type:complete len:449 (+),score=62.99 GFYU01015048.1:232-1578(+)
MASPSDTQEHILHIEDIFTEVCSKLDVTSLMAMALVCKEWRSLCNRTLTNEWFVEQLFDRSVKQEDMQAVQFVMVNAKTKPLLRVSSNFSARLLRMAIVNRNNNLLATVLGDPRVDPTVHDNYAIRRASQGGYADALTQLLADGRCDPRTSTNFCLRNGAERGHTEVVEALLRDGRADPTSNDGYAIRWASRNGHVDVVDRLLGDERVDPSVAENYAVRMSCMYGHAHVVTRLLQDARTNPGVWGLYTACRRGHVDVVKILLRDHRVTPGGNAPLTADTQPSNAAAPTGVDGGSVTVTSDVVTNTTTTTTALASVTIGTPNDSDGDSDDDDDADNVDVNEVLYCPIVAASEAGHIGIVSLLLQDGRFDPRRGAGAAVRVAFAAGHSAVVQLLLNDKRVGQSEGPYIRWVMNQMAESGSTQSWSQSYGIESTLGSPTVSYTDDTSDGDD